MIRRVTVNARRSFRKGVKVEPIVNTLLFSAVYIVGLDKIEEHFGINEKLDEAKKKDPEKEYNDEMTILGVEMKWTRKNNEVNKDIPGAMELTKHSVIEEIIYRYPLVSRCSLPPISITLANFICYLDCRSRTDGVKDIYKNVFIATALSSILYTFKRNSKTRNLFALLTSASFGLAHACNFNSVDKYVTFHNLASQGFLGLNMSYLAIRYGLLNSIIFHIIWNNLMKTLNLLFYDDLRNGKH